MLFSARLYLHGKFLLSAILRPGYKDLINYFIVLSMLRIGPYLKTVVSFS